MMKKIYTLTLVFLLFYVINVFGQSHGINYQAVIMDKASTTGIGDQTNYLPNNELILRFTIFNSEDKIDYQEEHVTSTDEFGMVSVVIGQGKVTQKSPISSRETFYDDKPSTTVTKRTFREISWDGTPKKLLVEVCIDKLMEDFYQLDEQNLNFVPYAHHRNITAIGTMDIEGVSNFNSELNVRRKHATNLSGNLNVEEHSTLNNTLTVNSTTQLNGQTVISADLSGNSADRSAYPLIVEGSKHGINIKVNESRTTKNAYVTFKDINGIQGQITGQTYSEIRSTPLYIYTDLMYVAKGITQIANIAAGSGSPATLTCEIASGVLLAVEWIGWKVFATLSPGVSYTSGSGDYAEWLPRANKNEMIGFGEIVGVKGGKISKNIDNAEQLMVVSKAPIILGNAPKNDSIALTGENVAFMGQVPVWVSGIVKQGDFIVAKKNGNGCGVAVSPDKINLNQMPNIVGKAWRSSQYSGKKLINTVVGLKTHEWVSLIKSNQKKVENLQKEVKELNEAVDISNEVLFKLVDGYKTKIENTKK